MKNVDLPRSEKLNKMSEKNVLNLFMSEPTDEKL